MKTKQRNITLEEANDFDSPVEVRFAGHVTYFHNDKEHGPRVKVLRRTPPAKYHDSGDTPEPVLVPIKHVFKTEVVPSSEEEVRLHLYGAAFLSAPESLVDTLNKVLVRDPAAINSIFLHRVPVTSEQLDGDSPLPLVLSLEEDKSATLSVLGIINSIFPFDAEKGGGAIAAIWDDNGRLEKFVCNAPD